MNRFRSHHAFRRSSSPRRGMALVAVLAAMAVMLVMLGGLLRLGLLGRRQLLRELDVRQAESLLEAAADRAVARLRAEPAWSGGSERVASDAIVGRGDAEVIVAVEAAGGDRRLRVVVDYPAGRPDSIRRERVFAVAPAALEPPSTPSEPPAATASPETSP